MDAFKTGSQKRSIGKLMSFNLSTKFFRLEWIYGESLTVSYLSSYNFMFSSTLESLVASKMAASNVLLSLLKNLNWLEVLTKTQMFERANLLFTNSIFILT